MVLTSGGLATASLSLYWAMIFCDFFFFLLKSGNLTESNRSLTFIIKLLNLGCSFLKFSKNSMILVKNKRATNNHHSIRTLGFGRLQLRPLKWATPTSWMWNGLEDPMNKYWSQHAIRYKIFCPFHYETNASNIVVKLNLKNGDIQRVEIDICLNTFLFFQMFMFKFF